MLEASVLRRVIVIAEAAAEETLIREIERLNFTAFSSVNCSGRCSRPLVDDVFMSSSHVRIEALGTPFLAELLMRFIRDELLERFSITCFTDSVEVTGAAMSV